MGFITGLSSGLGGGGGGTGEGATSLRSSEEIS